MSLDDIPVGSLSVILDWLPDRRRRARVTSELVGLHYG